MLPLPTETPNALLLAAAAADAKLVCKDALAAELVEQLRAPLLALALDDGAAAGRVIAIAGRELAADVEGNLWTDIDAHLAAQLDAAKVAISRPPGSFVVDGRCF